MQVVSSAKVKFGKQLTPGGEEFTGFSVTIGGITDPAEIQRTYDDIEAIMGKHQVPFKTHETDSPTGQFRSYTVETG